MAADDHLGEAWRAGWRAWLEEELPAGLAGDGFEVRESSEEGERPERVLVVAAHRVERVPAMPGTGRVSGLIALREPFDGSTVEEHRARLALLWDLLKTVGTKPGPLAGVYLHDLRWEDRESAVDDGDRVSGWLLSSMATRSNPA